ncbi:hypothetical protein OG21DRAFT_1605225, partial [Imleria badia]
MSLTRPERNPLYVADIFHIILDCLSEPYPYFCDDSIQPPQADAQSALAALAQTCRMFSEPSLNCLWRKLDSLRPLLRCVFPAEVADAEPGADSLRPPSLAEWNIIYRYSHRIRELQVCYDKSLFFLEYSVFEPNLLPNLRVLIWDPVNLSLAFIRPLLGPQLVSFRLGLNLQPGDDKEVTSFLKTLPSHCPGLKVITLDISLDECDSESVSAVLSQAVCAFEKLDHLAIHTGYTSLPLVDVVALRHLAMSPQFTQLNLVTQQSQVEELSLLRSDIPFSGVKKISLFGLDLGSIISLLRNEGQMFSNTKFYLHDPATSQLIHSFLTALASHPRRPSLQSISLGNEYSNTVHSELGETQYILSHDTLRPLVFFHNLRELSIDLHVPISLNDEELVDLAHGWPLLRKLCLVSWNRLSTKHLTLQGLLLLVVACPKLEHVNLSVDAREVPTSEVGMDVRGAAIRQLIFRESPIDDARLVAKFLLKHFPSVVRVIGHRSEYAEVWKRVRRVSVPALFCSRKTSEIWTSSVDLPDHVSGTMFLWDGRRVTIRKVLLRPLDQAGIVARIVGPRIDWRITRTLDSEGNSSLRSIHSFVTSGLVHHDCTGPDAGRSRAAAVRTAPEQAISLAVYVKQGRWYLRQLLGILYSISESVPIKWVTCMFPDARNTHWMGMESTKKDGSSMIVINTQHAIYSLLFAEDGKQVFSGGVEGVIRRWQVDDGHEVGDPIQTGGASIMAAAMSPDRRWLVFGFYQHPHVRVWDAQSRQKVLDIGGHTGSVDSVDISPDSTKLATGSRDKQAYIWSMTTGERLVGPLQHENRVVAVRFSPTGDRIATATGQNGKHSYNIRIFNSENGHQLLLIPCCFFSKLSSPLTWSVDGRQLFAASYNEVKRFDTSSGSFLSKWSIPGGPRTSIILSHKQKFAAIVAEKSLSFWDTATEKQIGAVINHASDVYSIALSPNDDYIATGEDTGKVTLRSLREILPRSYLTRLPFMNIDDAAFKSWTQGDLTRAEELLTEVITVPALHAHALAQRALVRSRLKQTDTAMNDAKMSIEAQRSVIGYIAMASERIVDNVVRGVSNTSPLVLIDAKRGLLCDGQKRLHTFKSEPEFKALCSSMTEELDDDHIQQVVVEYFRYVTLSHVWQGKEPSFQDVNLAGSVWQLESSRLNEKLRKFCEVVRTEGYRWAWSDTCCIDKTISIVLNQSLTMMYKWYEAAASTFVHLEDVDSLLAIGNLTGSEWMTRAWTAQELLAAKVIRFYDRNWKPYLGDTRPNHKESPEIMQELADAIGVARQTIIAFNPDDLTVRARLRLASTRNATVEEDVAYSLIGIFKSDIKPHYGEGDAALGHLLEEIVARSGEVT